MTQKESYPTIDALPYVDQGYDETSRSGALSLIEEECKRYRPTKNYLAHLPPPKYDAFETKAMKAEFERIQNRQPMEMLSMKRCDLPAPPSGKLTDLSAWQESVSNGHAQLEHQSIRLENIELLSEYGAEAWKYYMEMLQKMADLGQKQLADGRRDIQEIHYDRKAKQTEAGDRLRNLDACWVGLIAKNYEIEKACAEFERQLEPENKRMKLISDHENEVRSDTDYSV